jgi:RNA polymerase sigma factor (sigma-70 family)
MDEPGPRPEPAAARTAQSGRGGHLGGLLSAARDGDQRAIGQIVTELSPMLWQVARATGLDGGDAEDVLQTVWLKLFAHLDTIREPGALVGWLVTVTRREAWQVRKTGSRQVPADQEWLSGFADSRPGTEEQVVVSDQHRRLRHALEKLDPRCRELLRIVAFVPRPDYRAVAAELGMPVGSVGPTRGRCLAKLRGELAGTAEGSPR